MQTDFSIFSCPSGFNTRIKKSPYQVSVI